MNSTPPSNSLIKFLSVACALFLGIHGASAQSTTIFTEGFENTFPGTWTVGDSNPIGTPTFWSPVNSAFGGEGTASGGKKAYCAGNLFPNSSNASPTYPTQFTAFMERGLDLTNHSAAQLKFQLRIPSIEANFDIFRVLIDQTVIYSTSDSQPSWTLKTFDLSPYLGAIRSLRFEFISDSSATFEGAYLDDIEVTATPRVDYSVFGIGERTDLNNSASTNIVKSDRPSLTPTNFNNQNRTTRSVSIIHAGTLTIDSANDPDAVYSQFFNNPLNIANMEIVAETLVIRSPLNLHGTNVKIYARNLRFESGGKITTTPQALTTSPADATPTTQGGNGANGLAAGNIEVYTSTYTDATGNNNSKFILTGGAGQRAGKGRHGTNGANLSAYKLTHTVNTNCVFYTNTDVYTAPAGYYITRVAGQSGNRVYGTDSFPGDGTNAWRSGTPGNGGPAGTLRTNLSSIQGTYSGGAPGAPGTPSPSSTSSSTTQCVGGTGGLPRNSVQMSYDYSFGSCTPNWYDSTRHSTINGTSFPVPTASYGSNGSRISTGGTYDWLHPLLVRKAIDDAKDDYLQNRIQDATRTLNDYSGILALFRADPSFSSSPFKLELGQLHDESRILLQQIASGLDYFGNPGGWVPMLSYEVNANLFDQEISRSLDMIYLAQWIAGKQDNAAATITALSTARNELAEEVADAQARYTAARNALSNLQGEAQSITQKTNQLLIDLETKESQLSAQAAINAQPPDWEVGLRISLKAVGTVCKMIPVYQPALGSVGDVATLGSNFDPDKPWATVAGGLDIASQAIATNISDAAAAQATQVANASLNPEQLKAANATAARTQKLQNMANASSALSAGIGDISSYVEATKAPAEKIQAELEKLRSADPAYSTLVDSIKAVTEERRDYANRITTTALEIANLTDTITRGLLAMDALSVTVADSSKIINPKVNSYLKDMERRAFDRLLKYHYYLAKSYEYRLVKPYTGTLNLQSLYNSISSIANAPSGTNQDGSITDGQRNILKSVFKDIIAQTTQNIVTEANSNPPTNGSSFTFNLTPAQLATLNEGKPISLNLFELGFFPPTEENIRIVDLKAYDGGPSDRGIQTTGTFSSPSYVDLVMEHSGISNILSDGNVYQFRHYNQTTREAITWRSRYEPGTNALSPNPPIAPANSLLRSLLPTVNTEGILLHSQPSAWADIKIWRSGVNGGTSFGLDDNDAPLTLSRVTLQVFYNRNIRATSPARRNVEVVVSQSLTGSPVADPNSLPSFTVSRPDQNARQNALGRFLRIYPSSTTPVTITAPLRYGALNFIRWVNSQGVQQETSNTISLIPNSDRKVFAIYGDGTPNITSTLAASGNVGVPFSYNITADNSPDTFIASNLPAGLFYFPATGAIAGSPLVSGTFPVTISAANEYGPGNPATLVLTLSGTNSFSSAITLTGANATHSGTHSTAHHTWFRWTAPFSGLLNLNTFGSNFDTLLALYEGDSTTNLFLRAENDDAASTLQSQINYQVQEGVTYRFALTGYQGSIGSYTLNLSLTTNSDYIVLNSNGVILITDQTNTGTPLTVDQTAAGNIRFSAPGRTFSLNYGPNLADSTGNLSLSGISQIFVNSRDGSDHIILGPIPNGVPSILVEAGSGDDLVEISGNVQLIPDASVDIDLQDDAAIPGLDRFNLQSNAKIIASGVGSITVRCSQGIYMANGSKLETTAGDLTVEANQQEPASTGNFLGLDMDNAKLKSTTGLLTVKARGGNDPGGFQLGINVNNGSQITADSNLIVNGSGGPSTGFVNRGITVYGAGSLIRSLGNLEVTGIGGVNGSSYGIGLALLFGGSIEGYGDFSVIASGSGAPDSPLNFGVELGAGSSIIANGPNLSRIKGTGTGSTPGISLVESSFINGVTPHLNTDNLYIDSTSYITAASYVVVEPAAATILDLGGSNTPGTLGLPDAIFDRITSSAIYLASFASETIITAPITRSAPTTLYVFNPIGFSAPAAGVDLDLQGGSFSIFGSRMKFPITSANPNAGLPTLSINGGFDFYNFPGLPVTLDISGTTHPGSQNQILTLVANDGTDPITGPLFENLPEGSVIPWPGSPLFEARLSYIGGDGNDITLTLQTVSGFPNWAANNIPPGKDNTFDGDANGDGIPNGVAYVFGNSFVTFVEPGILNAPLSIPPDVDVYLERSTTLTSNSWTAAASWINGQPPVLAPGFILLNNEVRDPQITTNAFYRYRVVRR